MNPRFLIFAAALASLVLAGCATPPAPAVPPKATGPLRGVSLSPKSYGAVDFMGFLAKAKQAGGVLSWAGDWVELDAEKGAPVAVVSQKGFTPVIMAQFFSPVNGKLLRPLDERNKQEYARQAVAFAKKFKPAYLGLGIEINVLYEKSPQDFQNFVSFFDQAYDVVKAASPETKVFTVFQLERLKGMRGGLFGGTNDPSKNDWQLLERFPKADMFAFTTYPGLIYKEPAGMPSDYYSEIASHTDKPIAFTEIGWHSAASPKGWEGSEDEQADFARRFFDLTSKLKPELEIWPFLYDQQTVEPFDSMGLIRRDGAEKAAWEAWKK